MMSSSDLFLPDGKSLHKVVVGQSGSGKSVFLEEVAKDYIKINKDPNWRLIYFSPKNEGFVDLLPKDRRKRPIGLVGSVDDMIKSLQKNFVTVFYPDSYGLDDQMNDTIDALFDFKEANPDFKATLVIDDSQVFLSARRESSEAQRRLALLGRSRS
jgi:ABC-type dipeptide/oligopeptide/nickel transport system ATPase component